MVVYPRVLLCGITALNGSTKLGYRFRMPHPHLVVVWVAACYRAGTRLGRITPVLHVVRFSHSAWTRVPQAIGPHRGLKFFRSITVYEIVPPHLHLGRADR